MLIPTFALVGMLATILSAAVVPALDDVIPRAADAVKRGNPDEIVFVGVVPNKRPGTTPKERGLASRDIVKRDGCNGITNRIAHFRTGEETFRFIQPKE